MNPYTRCRRTPTLLPFGVALIGYCLVIWATGLSMTEDALKNSAWARDFSNHLAALVPQIELITSLGTQPNVNRFYLSLLWAGSPFFVLLVLCERLERREMNRTRGAGPRPDWFRTAVAFVLAVALWYVINLNGRAWEMPMLQALFSTPIGRTVLASAILCLLPLVGVVSLALCVWDHMTGYLSRHALRHRHGERLSGMDTDRRLVRDSGETSNGPRRKKGA